METEGVGVADLTPAAVERVVAERRRAGYRSSVSPKSLRPLLAYVGGLGVLRGGDGEPLTPVEKLLAEYRDYLLVERALTAGPVGLYEPVARLFLEERSAPIGEDLARWSGSTSGPLASTGSVTISRQARYTFLVPPGTSSAGTDWNCWRQRPGTTGR
jgi:hypothetical protein